MNGIKLYFLLILVFLVSIVSAQKVDIIAYVEAGKVFVHGRYKNGSPVENGKVEVFNGIGKKLLEGTTDETGKFSFSVSEETDLKIILDVGLGRRAETTLGKSEISKGKEPKDKGNKQKRTEAEKTEIEDEKLRTLIREVMDEKLYPIMKIIARLEKTGLEQKGITLTEILGGFGYIIGILGIIMYFRRKR